MFDGEVLSDDSVKLPVDKADVVRPDFGRSQRSAERVLSISEVTARFFDDTTSRSRSNSKTVLRPLFSKAPSGNGVAQFFLSPPKTIPVHEGVRPRVAGKFIFVGDEKFYIRGVTYGPFRPDDEGCEYHTPEMVDKDFALMAENGINSVRTYTVPPRWLLDIAQNHGLRVMVGLPWEEHIAFLEKKKIAQDIENRVRAGVRECAGHPALLCFTVGNEIPASIVRWYGRRKIEAFLQRLYKAVKQE
ncbi:MAG: hypothetical protein HGA63_04600, partial [Syntrophobacteraceae bacterium]|nr:hypothetical protein [Syntrophobacteraceae bacterium]